jgi:hypothetical protein
MSQDSSKKNFILYINVMTIFGTLNNGKVLYLEQNPKQTNKKQIKIKPKIT